MPKKLIENHSSDIPLQNVPAIELYDAVIKALADSEASQMFANSGAQHAAIVFSNIFRTAKHNINMYVGNFEGKVSDESNYLNSLNSYLDKGLSLSIIFENEPNVNSKALELLKIYQEKNRIPIRKLEGDSFKSAPHFIVADNRMIRLEEDKHNFKAICSFNNESLANDLNDAFDLIKSHSINIDLSKR